MENNTARRGIFGVGYEGKGIDAFICGLLVSGTRILADVRLNAISRKRGFSKRLLENPLPKPGSATGTFPNWGIRAGIGPDLAVPAAEIRVARARFAGMIGGEAASKRLEEIADAARDDVVAVMCVEADERACHRYVIIQELCRRLDLCRQLSNDEAGGEGKTRPGS